MNKITYWSVQCVTPMCDIPPPDIKVRFLCVVQQVTGLDVLVLHHRCELLVVPLLDTLFPLIHHILSHKLLNLLDLHLNHLFVMQVCVCILTYHVS